MALWEPDSGQARVGGGSMVEMVVHRVGINPQGQALVILADTRGERLLPIWIGLYEANAIAMNLRGEMFERPLTHDLLSTLLQRLGHELVRVEIPRLEEGTFYAVLVISDGEDLVTVDARPSDSLALALRAEAPVLVAEGVLDEAGIYASDVADADELETFKHLMERLSDAPGPGLSDETGPAQDDWGGMEED
jgi:uncharacterized protein